MKKQLVVILCFFLPSAHAAWYDVPARWFNQSMAWLRQRTSHAYQQLLVKAGYRAYQQQETGEVVPTLKEHPTVQLQQQLRTFITPQLEAALTAYERMTTLEKQWAKEEKESERRTYLWLLEGQQKKQYPAQYARLLADTPILKNLDAYQPLIATLAQAPDAGVNAIEYFPELSSVVTQLTGEQRAIINNLLIWIARMTEYLNNPWSSKYSLETIHQRIIDTGNRFIDEISGINSAWVVRHLVENRSKNP